SRLGLRNCPGSVDQTNMAKGLWEIAEQLARCLVHLFRQQSHVIHESDGPLKCCARLRSLSGHGLGLRQPECAQEERPFPALQAVVRAVAIDQATLVGEPVTYGVNCSTHARV